MKCINEYFKHPDCWDGNQHFSDTHFASVSVLSLRSLHLEVFVVLESVAVLIRLQNPLKSTDAPIIKRIIIR